MDDLSKEINEFLRSHLRVSPEVYSEIKPIYETSYKLSEIQTIKNQVCECMIFGTYIAAMTLINHMFEQFLKFALMYDDSLKSEESRRIDKKTPFALLQIIKPSNEKFFRKNLNENIDTAFKANLIDQSEKDLLLLLKEKYRNAYAHGDRRKLYGQETIPIEEIIIEDGEFKSKGKKMEEKFHFPFADFLFLHSHAEVNCVDYLKKLDKIIRNVEDKIFPNIKPSV